MVVNRHLENEEATLALARTFANKLEPGMVIYLSGDLGAGKTTFSRGLIQSLGHRGAVKSPTYTLVESYRLPKIDVHHFDLYRLADPEELEYMGIRDYFDGNSLAIVEWPSRGEGVVAAADIEVEISHLIEGRDIVIKGKTARGESWLASHLK